LGANLEVDVAYQYLRFFLEDDDKLKRIGEEYSRGELMTGQVKGILIELLSNMVEEHQKRRAGVTDEVVKSFMDVRPLDF